MPDQAPTDPAPSDDEALRQAIEDRLAARIARYRTQRDNRRRRLAELSERRTAGLRARHATRLARTQPSADDENEGTPTC